MEDKKSLHILTWCIIGSLAFAAAVFIFGFGVFVGEERAGFSFRWAENYHRNFGGPRNGFFDNFPTKDFISGHGVFGQIIKIESSIGLTNSLQASSGQVTLIIKDQDNVEKTVITSDKTVFVNASGAITLSSLKVDDRVVVIGSPNQQGQIEAKFIRVIPNQNLSPTFLRYLKSNI